MDAGANRNQSISWCCPTGVLLCRRFERVSVCKVVRVDGIDGREQETSLSEFIDPETTVTKMFWEFYLWYRGLRLGCWRWVGAGLKRRMRCRRSLKLFTSSTSLRPNIYYLSGEFSRKLRSAILLCHAARSSAGQHC